MEYRRLPRGGEMISILGLGTSSIQQASEKEIEETIRLAVENGINYFDMASARAKQKLGIILHVTIMKSWK